MAYGLSIRKSIKLSLYSVINIYIFLPWTISVFLREIIRKTLILKINIYTSVFGKQKNPRHPTILVLLINYKSDITKKIKAVYYLNNVTKVHNICSQHMFIHTFIH